VEVKAAAAAKATTATAIAAATTATAAEAAASATAAVEAIPVTAAATVGQRLMSELPPHNGGKQAVVSMQGKGGEIRVGSRRRFRAPCHSMISKM